MSAEKTIPFTYLIGWSKYQLFYYGVRYKRGCKPSDMWTKYFTSSEKVKSFRAKYGEPDIIQVRKTFSTKEDAIIWEDKVLRRLKCVKDPHWLNMGRGGKQFFNAGGIPHTKERKANISKSRKNYLQNRTSEQIERDTLNSQEAGKNGAYKISQKARERFCDSEWFETVHLASHNTEEYKEKMSKAVSGEKNGMYGKVYTSEERKRISKQSSERWKDKELNDQRKKALKETLSTPESRVLKSKAAKESSAVRILARYILPSFDKEYLLSLSSTELVLLIRSHEKFTKYNSTPDDIILERTSMYLNK